MCYTFMTDDRLKCLQACSNLERLRIQLDRVTDAGLAHLKPLKNLQELDLSATDIQGPGLMELTALPNLKTVHLMRECISDGARINDEAVRKFQKAMPGLKLDRGNDNTADKRIRILFAIPDEQALTDKTIQAAVLAKIPLGSTDGQVVSLLKKCGIAKDGLSSVYPLSDEGQIVCRVEYDPDSGYLVQTHYGIVFQMDARKKLTDVEVKVWYTGP